MHELEVESPQPDELPVLTDVMNLRADGPDVVLAVVGCSVYSAGLELHVAARSRTGRDLFWAMHRALGLEEDTDGGPRLVLSWGGRSAAGAVDWWQGPLGFRNAWGTAGRAYDGRYWHEVGVLPEDGILRVELAWPDEAVHGAREVDAGTIEGLRRAVTVLW